MTTFLLIPGADGRAWYWHLVVPELRKRGHDAVAVDLPPAPTATLADYTDAAVAAAEGHTGSDTGGLVVVGQSLGAFTAPLVSERLGAELLVLLNPMIPAPGERAGAWWGNTGQEAAAAEAAGRGGWPVEFDVRTHFFHDVPAAVTEEAFADAAGGAELDTLWTETWPLPHWPAIPTRVLQARDDRLFPLEFQQQVARERLGVEVDEILGGHLTALAHPVELADALVAYLR